MQPSVPPAPTGVAGTSLGVARLRAAESSRPDRLFDDPFASAFAAAGPPPQPRPDSEQGTGSSLPFRVVIRTRFFDDYLLAASRAGCRQVVLVAAGLDTRAFRLDWPAGTALYELDQPQVLDFKEAVLGGLGARPRCQRTVLPVDLLSDWATPLRAAGFDPDQPTAWLTEGLLIYLTQDQAAGLLTGIGALSSPGSQLAAERGGGAQRLIDEVRGTPRGDRLAAMWKGGLGQDIATWLSPRGWQTTSHDLAVLAESYGRPATTAITSGFVTALRV
jgi:methyltransferase (TIGR00027 family)